MTSLMPRCVDASDVPIRYLRAIIEVTHLRKRSCICDQECEPGHQDAATIPKCLQAQMVFVRGRAKSAHDSSPVPFPSLKDSLGRAGSSLLGMSGWCSLQRRGCSLAVTTPQEMTISINCHNADPRYFHDCRLLGDLVHTPESCSVHWYKWYHRCTMGVTWLKCSSLCLHFQKQTGGHFIGKCQGLRSPYVEHHTSRATPKQAGKDNERIKAGTALILQRRRWRQKDKFKDSPSYTVSSKSAWATA